MTEETQPDFDFAKIVFNDYNQEINPYTDVKHSFTAQDRKVIKEFATGFYYEDDTAEEGAESTEEIIDESDDND